MDDDSSPLEKLRSAVDEQMRIVAREEARLAQLEKALEVFENPSAVVPVRQDFRHMGIVEATAKLLDEVQKPLSTRIIADEIRKRGLVTKSKDFVPTVYATLKNSQRFTRDGRYWRLADK